MSFLGSGERLNLSTLDNTDYRDAARKMKELVEQHRSDDPPERIECAGAWLRASAIDALKIGLETRSNHDEIQRAKDTAGTAAKASRPRRFWRR